MQRAIISLDYIIKVKQLNRGDKLYHYTTIRGVKDILDSREFWATKSDYLNDKSEFRYIDEIITRVSMDKFRAPDFARYFAGAVSRELKSLLETSLDQNELLHGYYVISFSLLKNNSLLWTEYSGDIGYSIEFDYQELLDGISIHNAELLQWHGSVIYDEAMQYDCVSELLDLTLRQFFSDYTSYISDPSEISERALHLIVRYFSMMCIPYAMFFKNECFSGEKEYRFIFDVYHEQNEDASIKNIDQLKFRHKDQRFIPFISVTFADYLSELPVDSILVGPKNDADLAVKGVQLYLRSLKSDIPVIKSDIPLRF